MLASVKSMAMLKCPGAFKPPGRRAVQQESPTRVIIVAHRSPNKDSSLMPSKNTRVAVSRRNLLSCAPLSLSFLAGLHAQPSSALAIEAQTSFFNNNGISFEYPAGWLKAYDRTDKGAVGGLILIGDFKAVDTISLVSSEIPEELQNLADGSIDSQVVAQEVLKEPLSSTSTMSLDIIAAERVEGHAPGPTYRIEYVLEVCRGSREEGVGGKLSCVGPKGNELQTVKRHHVDLITEKSGVIYKFSVSAEEERWQQVSLDLLRALDTFLIAA